VQSSLNMLMGAGLNVDGIAGPATWNAIAAFCRRRRFPMLPAGTIAEITTNLGLQRVHRKALRSLAQPIRMTDVEEAAAEAHVDPPTLEQARADLGTVVGRANTGGAHAAQWSLPS